MRLIDAVDAIFSHNEMIAIWEKEDKHHNVLVWRGMAWQLPEEYENVDRWQIVGVMADKITESDQLNININDAVTLKPTADAYSKGYVEQIRWERDMAIQQLNDYGVQFGEKADVQIVRYGKWVPIIDEYDTRSILSGYKCSLCGRYEEKEESYCHCGAKMDGE